MRRIGLALAIASTICCGARNSPSPLPSNECGDRRVLDGLCVGAPNETPCGGSKECVSETACTTRIAIANDSALQKALTTASAGSCLVLDAGTYGDANVTTDVSLLGKGLGAATLKSVKSSGTTTLENLVIGEGGARATSGKLTLRRVRIGAGTNAGVQVEDADLAIYESTFENRNGSGVVAVCKTRCGTDAPKVRLEGVKIADDKYVGALFVGSDVTLRAVEIARTAPKDFQFGRGIELQGCTVHARGLDVHDSPDVGMLLIETSGTLGPLVTASKNHIGFFVRKPTAGELQLTGFDLYDNAGVSIALDQARDILIDDGHIGPTVGVNVPVSTGGSLMVGDGLIVGANCGATVTSKVRIERSARRPVILDATSRGRFEAQLLGDDATIGVLVQGGTDPGLPPDLFIAPGTKVERKLAGDALPVWPTPSK